MKDLNEEVRAWSWTLSLTVGALVMARGVDEFFAGNRARALGDSMALRKLAAAEHVWLDVSPRDAAQAALFLRRADHGSPLWRLLVCIASGKVTREDLRILAEVVEALADG